MDLRCFVNKVGNKIIDYLEVDWKNDKNRNLSNINNIKPEKMIYRRKWLSVKEY